jgi:cobalt-zinc-cadmium efflux system membrane fusion protein
VRLASARSALAIAEQDFARASSLSGSISERDRFAREQAVAVARTAAAEAEAVYRKLGAGASTREIRAPLSGVLTAVLHRPGDSVQAGESLFRIVDSRDRWAEVRISEGDATKIEVGDPVVVTAAAYPGMTFPGRVVDPGHEVDPSTGQVRTTISIDADAVDLRPGTSVRATVRVTRAAAVEGVTIPASAVTHRSGEPFVFVKTSPETFAVRPVRLGPSDGESQQVEAGVDPGERVVVRGLYTLRTLAGR